MLGSASMANQSSDSVASTSRSYLSVGNLANMNMCVWTRRQIFMFLFILGDDIFWDEAQVALTYLYILEICVLCCVN